MTLSIDPYAVIADYYDHFAAAMTEDVDFYVAEALRASGPVVELAVGTGRIAIPIAQRGQRVIGIDASNAMITEGARRAAAAGVEDLIGFERGDMREWVASPPVELVMIPFRSFLHLTSSDDQLRALRAVHDSLVPGGRLAMNVFLPDPRVITDLDGRRVHQRDFVDERGRRCELWATNTYAHHDQTIHVRWTIEVHDGDRVADAIDAEITIRMVYRYEMQHLLEHAGFEVEHLYGAFDRSPFGEGSTEMIWIARKP